MELISTENFVECPFIIAKIGDYTFGSYRGEKQNDGLGYLLKVDYPNYMSSLDVVKINGEVNTYTLKLVYAITENDDPNMLDKVFSSISRDRIMTLTYGDWNSPATIYKEESVLITNIKTNVSIKDSKITYTVTGVSNALNLKAAKYDFPARTAKPSAIIRDILYTPSYGLLDIFTGMIKRSLVNSSNLIPSDDKTVYIEAKSSTSALDYIIYLTSYMSSTTNNSNSALNDSMYRICILDDISNIYGGPYFKIVKVDPYITRIGDFEFWEMDIGYIGKNFVTGFDIENDESWSILYDYQDKIAQSSYVYRIDNSGNLVTESSPSIIRSRQRKVTTEKNKNWWTSMTQFPITARLTIKGLIRPTIIMDYIKLNVLFYGNKHVSSGVYVITKQEDSISANGYRTVLTLLRVGGDI